MIKDGKGGSNTQTGLKFENRVNISKLFEKLKGYTVKENKVYFENELVAELYQKNKFYKEFLELHGIDYKKILSKKWLPDQVVFVIGTKTIYIIEIKFQKCGGSVDEKLQTCDFKKKHYSRLLEPLKMNLEYVYLLNDWFKQVGYRDTLEYIRSVDCNYFFNKIPLSFLGLPE
jgi:hypothetical protein